MESSTPMQLSRSLFITWDSMLIASVSCMFLSCLWFSQNRKKSGDNLRITTTFCGYYFLLRRLRVSSTVSSLREKKVRMKKSETFRKPFTAPSSIF